MSSLTLLQRYEAFLQSLRLFPALFKIKSVEMDLTGELNPSAHLDRLFFEEERWLDFESFHQYYFARFGPQLKALCGAAGGGLEEGVKARLYRTQFGFLTEYHAYHLACSLFGNDQVKRSVAIDLAGVDFQILLHQNLFNIHIFVDSQRAWEYRRYKSLHKNGNHLPGTHVNLPYSLKKGQFNSLRFLPNGFGVYTSEYFKHLEKEILAGRIKNNNINGTTATGFIYTH